MIDARLTGGEAVAKAAARLERLSDTRQLHDVVERALDPVLAEIPERAADNALARLPHRNGLAADVARRSRHTRERIPGGLRVSARARIDVASLNRGRLRHPLYGDREHWYDQPVQPKWWTDAVIVARAKTEPALRRAIEELIGGRP